MKYYSTNRKSELVSFRDAAIEGLAPDGGLYFPDTIPTFDKHFFGELKTKSLEEIAYRILMPYVGECMKEDELFDLVEQAFDFPIPLKEVQKDQFVLELFHGNTLAFKDVGARFMSRCLGRFVKDQDRKMTVLVATSGDTGGAVADGFYGIEGVDVVILFPSGKVSAVQEKQLTAMGGNIHALEIEGDFDDCQRLVKQAFSDTELRKKIFLTSANSINVARWIPQQLFFFMLWKQWPNDIEPPVVSVPSGNFGNICAGLLAKKSGLPIKKFIAACNQNDVVPRFLENGKYETKSTIHTISNAMDVGSPSNFVRIMELYDKDLEALKNDLAAYRYTDVQTERIMLDTYAECHYLLDPHGAVGLLALQEFQEHHSKAPGIFAATAHPIKFFDTVQRVVDFKLELPVSISKLMQKDSLSLRMPADYSVFKDYCFQGP
ncbi:MAG: threonine synthase [Sphingomonadales bacterium]|nr:threonine synthase [Sphingomonadales bacterium]MBM3923390.1 threonine synthase [Sphingomonadales bacterium]